MSTGRLPVLMGSSLRIATLGLLLAGALLATPFSTAQQQGASTIAPAAYQKLPEIESQLYGHAYPSQNMAQRVSRIERTLFGAPQRGPVEQRAQSIVSRVAEENAKLSVSEQEPLIQYLEDKLFQRTFPEKPLPVRLQQLENQVFGRAFEQYPVSVRIKKLAYAMPLMAKEIRLTKNDGQVIASASRLSPRTPRGNRPKYDPEHQVIELEANGNPARILPTDTSLSTGNYFQVIHRLSNGSLMRWETLPIKVAIKQGSDQERALSLQALQAWQQSFSITPVSNHLAADVILSWDKADWDRSVGVVTRPVSLLDERRAVRTAILINLYPIKEQPPEKQAHMVAHQLGHAFGLWGHSDDPGDLMYPVLSQEMNDYPSRWSWRSAANMRKVQPTEIPEGYQPSQRDINTLLKVYDAPAADLSTYNPY